MKAVNGNDHAIRVRDNDDNLVRILPGEVIDADGSYADRLSGTNGVRSASSHDERLWTAAQDARNPATTSPTGVGIEGRNGVTDVVLQARAVASDNLQVVVGDNEAPHGPPSGVITTKEAVRESGDLLDRMAYGEPGYDQAVRADAAREPREERPPITAGEGQHTPPVHVDGSAAVEATTGDNGDPESGDASDDLSELSRSDLNARAKAAGVEDADKLPNKGAVIEAIKAKE